MDSSGESSRPKGRLSSMSGTRAISLSVTVSHQTTWAPKRRVATRVRSSANRRMSLTYPSSVVAASSRAGRSVSWPVLVSKS